MSAMMTGYQEYIHKSKYARWDYEKERRETWGETVDRYINYMRKQVDAPDSMWKIARAAILNLEVMPSMRAMMTAGEPLDRCNVPAYNCFTSDETFITDEGIKTFGETVGEQVVVLSQDQTWRTATVQSFGKQKTQRVTFRPTKSKSNVRVDVKTTPNHRWITENRGVVDDLRVGDSVPSNVFQDLPFNREAFIRGFGFGDGTLDNRGNAVVRLCGDKTKDYVSFFEDQGATISYYEYMDGDAMCRFKQGEFSNWKSLPYEFLEDITYLSSWLKGYFAADGSEGKQPTLSAQDAKALDFVEYIAPLCGKVVTGRSVEKNLETNYGTRSQPLGKIVLRDDCVFYVTSIEELETEEVYCVVEPETETFTLGSGILTKNCAYAPVNSLRTFDEALYILMCGTGLGFSVEEKYTHQLPTVPNELLKEGSIVVQDSKEGWAKAFRTFLHYAFDKGVILEMDVSLVRPAGEVLKTFGGRASGPKPFLELISFVTHIVQGAKGRRLTTLECHDIMCKIAQIVVVGGVEPKIN